MSEKDEDLLDDDDDIVEDIVSDGSMICWQDWDSGGAGAGAGRTTVYRYRGAFYVLHDAGLDGPYPSKEEAAARNGVLEVNSATVAIWDSDDGYVYRR